jgi:hypothetical protein
MGAVLQLEQRPVVTARPGALSMSSLSPRFLDALIVTLAGTLPDRPAERLCSFARAPSRPSSQATSSQPCPPPA